MKLAVQPILILGGRYIISNLHCRPTLAATIAINAAIKPQLVNIPTSAFHTITLAPCLRIPNKLAIPIRKLLIKTRIAQLKTVSAAMMGWLLARKITIAMAAVANGTSKLYHAATLKNDHLILDDVSMPPNRYSAKAWFGLSREGRFDGLVSCACNQVGCAKMTGDRFGLSGESGFGTWHGALVNASHVER